MTQRVGWSSFSGPEPVHGSRVGDGDYVYAGPQFGDRHPTFRITASPRDCLAIKADAHRLSGNGLTGRIHQSQRDAVFRGKSHVAYSGAS